MKYTIKNKTDPGRAIVKIYPRDKFAPNNPGIRMNVNGITERSIILAALLVSSSVVTPEPTNKETN